ncbi:unnamed protein product [Prunus armeniaca]
MLDARDCSGFDENDNEISKLASHVKKVNKVRLAEYIEAMSGVKFWSQVSLDTMFDVHTKRILEYKRRLLNILGIIH